MKLKGRKVLCIIAQRNFRDEEFSIPKEILEKEGAKVVVASITLDEAIGMFGLRVKPDLTVRNANPYEFCALLIIGGSGSPQLADYPEVINIIRRFEEQRKVIAAICLAPYVLARAGILRGRRVTVFPADFAITELRRSGAIYEEKHVVVDDNLITADGPKVAKEFGEEIVKVLTSKT